MDLKPSADGELIARIKNGDATGLDDLYQRYARPVYSLALKVLGDPSMAEDVSQEVFLKLWRQPQSYDPGRGALSSWLLSVTHNRAVDVFRRRRSREERSLTDGDGIEETVPATVLDDLGELAALAETSAAVRRAMGAIPAQQRQAIEMAFFQGKTHMEIADELGEPLGTTKTRIRLGMRKLRQILEAEGVGALR
jgi:RNA polymerase sigma-70 factor (ECF subfamily)